MKRFVAVFIMLMALVMVFSACQITGCSYSRLDYDDAIKYKKGGATIDDEITSIEIEWLVGSVNVEYYDGDSISFAEECNQELNDRYVLRYLREGSTLHIKYAKKGKFPLGVGAIKKDLTVKLPSNLLLSSLEIDSVSADVRVSGENKTMSNINIESVSGGIELIANAKSIDVETVSGNVAIASNTDDLGLETVSGDASIGGSFNSIEATSVSGDIAINADTLKNCEISTTSGGVLLVTAENSFTLEKSTVSGHFECEQQTSTQGDKIIYGNGANNYEISTVSGDITIKKK